MAGALLVALISVLSPLSRAGNIDIISRLDRSFIPYSGLSSSPYPMRRYRYPIYKGKRAAFSDTDFQSVDDEDDGDVDKRYLRGINLRPLMFSSERTKKMSGITPRYDLSMTPYDLKVMAKLHRNGRRKRTPEVYDLKHIYRILEAGKKRSSVPETYDVDEEADGMFADKRDGSSLYDMWDASRMQAAGKKRSPVNSYYDLLNMAKMAKAGKRSSMPGYDLLELARMQEAGKRSYDGQNLLDLARMHDAGKRSVDQQSIFDLARMHHAGKRTINGRDLWNLARMHEAGKRTFDEQSIFDLARMHEAGKRSVDSMTLLDLARMEAAGKRSSPPEDYRYLYLARALNEAGKRTGYTVNPFLLQERPGLYLEESEDGEEPVEDDEDVADSPGGRGEKKKRSFDDYFGWDRKKKSVGVQDMTDDYLKTLKKQVVAKAENKSNLESVKKSQSGAQD